MEEPFLDLDRTVESAFAFLRARLEQEVDLLEIDHKLTIRQMAGHRSQKLLEVTKTSSGLMVWALDNSSLPPERKLSRQAMARLRALGFQRWKALPGYYVAVFGLTRADRVALVLVEVIRTIHGVLHPALLSEPAFATRPVSVRDAPPMPRSPFEPVRVFDLHHLTDLIAHVFGLRGLTVEWDADRVAHTVVGGCPVSLSPAGDLDAVLLTVDVPVHRGAPARLAEILEQGALGPTEYPVLVADGRVVLEALLHAAPFRTDFVLDMLDDMLAERLHVAAQVERLLQDDQIRDDQIQDDPLIRPDGVDE